MEQRIASLSAELKTERLYGSALGNRLSDLNGDLNHRLNRLEEMVAQLDENSGPTEPVREINTPVSRESEKSAEEFKQWVESISSEMDDKTMQSQNGSDDNQVDYSGELIAP